MDEHSRATPFVNLRIDISMISTKSAAISKIRNLQLPEVGCTERVERTSKKAGSSRGSSLIIHLQNVDAITT